jgi:hypothetical protein
MCHTVFLLSVRRKRRFGDRTAPENCENKCAGISKKQSHRHNNAVRTFIYLQDDIGKQRFENAKGNDNKETLK